MSHCISAFYVSMKDDCMKMLNSLLYFHPELTVEIYNKDDIDRFGITLFYYPSVGLTLRDKYSTITHIDSDVIVVDKLDDLFLETSDVRCGRNNSDSGKAGTNAAFVLPNISSNMYVNAGIHSVSNYSFWDDWKSSCNEYGLTIPLGEQGVLNKLFYSGKYSATLLDPIESKIHYGTSFLYGNRTHWDSWKEIYVHSDKLYINGKQIKMLHFAGGVYPKPDIDTLVQKEVSEYIHNILERKVI